MGNARAAVIAGKTARGSRDAGARYRLKTVMNLLDGLYEVELVDKGQPDPGVDLAIGLSWSTLRWLTHVDSNNTRIWFDACDSTFALRTSQMARGHAKQAAALARDVLFSRRIAPDLVSYISAADAEADRKLWSSTAVLPVRWPEIPLGEAVSPRRIVMAGDGTYGPNRAAAKWILQVLGPTLLSRGCTSPICIYGHGYGMSNSANVTFVGYAEDPRDVFRENDIHVAPIATGAGMKSKVAIPMLAGLTVVTTPQGINGLRPTDRTVVTELDGFAGAIEALFEQTRSWSGRNSPESIHLVDQTDDIRRLLNSWIGESPTKSTPL